MPIPARQYGKFTRRNRAQAALSESGEEEAHIVR
jgi:hypothetical protein